MQLHHFLLLKFTNVIYLRYGTLDVKNILLETVSHHILPQMLRSPLWSETADLLKEYIKFMDDYFNEAADLTFLAYRHRNYSKVCGTFFACLRIFMVDEIYCSLVKIPIPVY